jgi:hypothetical protein
MAVVFAAESVSAASIACLQEWEKVVPTVPVDKDRDPAGYVSGVRTSLISGHFLKFWPLGYRPGVESCYVSILAGKIEKGDYERFRAFVGEHYKAMWRFTFYPLEATLERLLRLVDCCVNIYFMWKPLP